MPKKNQKISNNPKTSKIDKLNGECKKLNPHASISNLCLCLLYIESKY